LIVIANCATHEEVAMSKKRRAMRGTVNKVIKPITPNEPEKAEIEVHEAEDLYRELRIENVLTDERGQKQNLKPGADVDVIIEADSSDTTTKSA
jgi:hypothetical protein